MITAVLKPAWSGLSLHLRLRQLQVTGTPGTGKTTTCEQLACATGFTHINVGDWVKQHELHSGWDEEFGSYVLDEDKVRGHVYACVLHLHPAPGSLPVCCERQGHCWLI